jgi:glycosyltransferase involved in cell wall biosynthesis
MAKILAFRGKDNAVHTYRMGRILGSLKNHEVTIRNYISEPGKKQTIGELAKELKALGDIWIVKYLPQDPDPSKNLMNILLSCRKLVDVKLIFDIDDDIFGVGIDNPAYWYFRENYGAYDYLVREADWVTVSTATLKALIQEKTKNVSILPNVIDKKDWKGKKLTRDGVVTIGWVYSRAHTQDALVEVNDALEALYKKYGDKIRIEILGGEADIFVGFPYTAIPAIPFAQYPKRLVELGWDIGLAPLADNRFNLSKSNIKWLEGSMAGQAMVMSNMPPYSDSVKNGKTGFLATSKRQWKKALDTLISNPELRAKMVEEAQKTILEKYEIGAVKKSYDSFYTVIV